MCGEVRFRYRPVEESVARVRTPSVSRSQSGVAAPMQALITERDPNVLIDAHASPVEPLDPRIRDSAVDEPSIVDKAPISIIPAPNFAYVAGVFCAMSNTFRGDPPDLYNCSIALLGVSRISEVKQPGYRLCWRCQCCPWHGL